MARRKQPVIPDALLDQLLAGADANEAVSKEWRSVLPSMAITP